MKKNKINPIAFAFIIPIVVIILALILILNRRDSMGEYETFPEAQYPANYTSIQGNVYVLEGIIDQQLAQSDNGRVLSVKMLNKDRRLPILAPITISNNFSVGQRYVMIVRVKKDLLVIEKLKKF